MKYVEFNVLLAFPPLAVVLIVQIRNRFSQRPDTGRWTILPTMTTDIN
jgi:hypothetical protein